MSTGSASQCCDVGQSAASPSSRAQAPDCVCRSYTCPVFVGLRRIPWILTLDERGVLDRVGTPLVSRCMASGIASCVRLVIGASSSARRS